jgi:signal transduction histidine kinase
VGTVNFLEEIQRYVGFRGETSEVLARFLPIARPAFSGIISRFYDRILDHSEALKVFSGPEQIARQKQTIFQWMESGFAGPHDQAYYEKRSRIGRVHVEIGLPQHYMLTAMNVLRLEFRALVYAAYANDVRRQHETNDAIDRLFDLELAIMLDTYAEDSQDRVRRNERLAVIGQLAASIGHDLRNPLGVIESSVYILRKRLDADERAMSHLQKITNQVSTCNQIVTDLLEMARRAPARLDEIDLNELAHEVIESVAPKPGIETRVGIEPSTKVRGERGLLRQCLINLVTNALHALDEKPGEIEIRASRGENDEMVTIDVIDSGPGFAPHIIRRAFEPLVTTHANGTGLGLALVKSVVERHGGTVMAHNNPAPKTGATVRIVLPVQPTPPVAPSSQASP